MKYSIFVVALLVLRHRIPTCEIERVPKGWVVVNEGHRVWLVRARINRQRYSYRINLAVSPEKVDWPSRVKGLFQDRAEGHRIIGDDFQGRIRFFGIGWFAITFYARNRGIRQHMSLAGLRGAERLQRLVNIRGIVAAQAIAQLRANGEIKLGVAGNELVPVLSQVEFEAGSIDPLTAIREHAIDCVLAIDGHRTITKV